MCKELGVEICDNMEDYEITQQVFDPCFVTHFSREPTLLAKLNPENPDVIDVYELIIYGQENSPT